MIDCNKPINRVVNDLADIRHGAKINLLMLSFKITCQKGMITFDLTLALPSKGGEGTVYSPEERSFFDVAQNLMKFFLVRSW